MPTASFVWDEKKNDANLKKHQVSFPAAQAAFRDLKRVIARDLGHSEAEERFFVLARLTVVC